LARRWTILLSIGLLVLILDQATKYWAVAHLTRAFQLEKATTPAEKIAVFLDDENRSRIRARPVVVSREHLRFRYVENPGAAWGMFGSLPDGVRVPFFLAISAFAIAFIVAFYRRLPARERMLQIAMALILGGAIGNLVDRLLRGYVIDFIDVHWRNDPNLHFPTFNVADIGITVGVALLLSQSFFGRRASEGAIATADSGAPFEPASAAPAHAERSSAPSGAAPSLATAEPAGNPSHVEPGSEQATSPSAQAPACKE
jgi:signal peptidase II